LGGLRPAFASARVCQLSSAEGSPTVRCGPWIVASEVREYGSGGRGLTVADTAWVAPGLDRLSLHRMGIVVGLVLAVESIPLGILVSALLDSSLRRRARFALRLATFTVIQTAPAVVLIAAAALRVLGEHRNPTRAGSQSWRITGAGPVPAGRPAHPPARYFCNCGLE
jgi:hypothetical protein